VCERLFHTFSNDTKNVENMTWCSGGTDTYLAVSDGEAHNNSNKNNNKNNNNNNTHNNGNNSNAHQ